MKIRRLLIANRGEIAARIMRTAHSLGMSTVAVYSDADAAAPYVHMADEAIRLPGSTAATTYLRADLIVEAALKTGADAIHPGYGFLSENAGFAQACLDAGLTFVGPAPSVIAVMGSKVEAKAMMLAAGIPTLPGATITAESDLAEVAAAVRFPLLVKAAFGGGGRGMRLVYEPAELTEAVARAQSEAASAFGDGTVFVERFVQSPRHIEVQILGDSHGNIVHLFERECSIQRRYQKVIEEAPSPAVTPALRAELGAAAVAAGKAMNYTGAGTVEFVMDPSGAFYFLEVNTRLQVEHPVTECVTGLDLVELQLRIAEGELLPEEARSARLTGHAIEARLYAEDPAAGYVPATGKLHRFRFPSADGVRVDAGVVDGSIVSPFYDAMLAKVIAHGRTRSEAIQRLSRTLRRAHLHGVTTNRDLLVGVLAEPEFANGQTDTGFLDRHDAAALCVTPDTGRHAIAAALALQAGRRRDAAVAASLPSGWRNVTAVPQRCAFTCGGQTFAVEYRLTRDGLEASVNDVPLEDARLIAATPDEVVLETAGHRQCFAVHAPGDGDVYVDGPDGSSALTIKPRLAAATALQPSGSLLAPMPGTVIRVLAQAGDAVTTGQPLVVMEAMKMEHTVFAPEDGTLTELRVVTSRQVDAGEVLAVVEGVSLLS